MAHDLTRFLELAKNLGADEAKIIDPVTIKTAAWVRLKCMYGCSSRRGRCCPPHTPTPGETQEIIDCYEQAMLIHCRQGVHPTKIVVQLEREMFLAGYYKAFGLGYGVCELCRPYAKEKCAYPGGENCAHPAAARPSMEACGIDVFATVRANGFPIDVLPDWETEGNYYGLLLIE
ncbi:MAG: DUF2284 domain-containing protein [Peptococcaceae bacterium]|jgi:predicted metal-binding protein|nr:DUF2284 domain-containing protein [Peptococcaceae bacterium]